MKKYLFVILIMISCFSCQRNITEVLKKEAIVKASKLKFKHLYRDYGPSFDTLEALGKYSNSLKELVILLSNVKGNKKLNKLIRKVLVESMDFGHFCSDYIFSKDFKREMDKNCIEGYFNICPRSYLILNGFETIFLNMLKISLGETIFNKTDCFSLLEERK